MTLRQTRSIKRALNSKTLLAIGGLISMNAHGMVPAPFDDWTADSAGIITASCPSDYKCTTQISDKNFHQEIMQELINGVVTKSSKVFYRQIISEKDMTSESIVKANNRALYSASARHGIASKTTLGQSQTTKTADTNFSAETKIYTGWASEAGTPDLQMTQTIDEAFRKKAATGSNYAEGKFDSVTSIKANYDADGNRTGFAYSTFQSNQEPGGSGSSSSGSWGGWGDWGGWGGSSSSSSSTGVDSQTFKMVGLEGDMLTSSGSAGGVSYSAGDKLWGHAITQLMNHGDTTGGGTQTNGGCDSSGENCLEVSFEQYDNRSHGAMAVNYFSYADNNITKWPSIFGDKPTINSDKAKSVSGLFTPTAVGSAQADGRDAPLAFGQWDTVGREVDVVTNPNDYAFVWTGIPNDDGSTMPDCAPGVVCSTGEVIAPGMIQRVVTDSADRRYIQTVVTDGSDFSIESFVSMAMPARVAGSGQFSSDWTGGYDESKAENGISMRMVNSDETSRTGVNGSVNSSVIIKTGWAARTDTPNIAMYQDINETGPASDTTFDQGYTHFGNRDAAGNMIGAKTDIDQVGKNVAKSYNSKYRNDSDEIRFAYRGREGNLQTTSGSGGGMSWSQGDPITATWVYNKWDDWSVRFGAVFYDNLADSSGYSDKGWEWRSYSGVGSNWLSSAFGEAPAGGSSSGGGSRYGGW